MPSGLGAASKARIAELRAMKDEFNSIWDESNASARAKDPATIEWINARKAALEEIARASQSAASLELSDLQKSYEEKKKLKINEKDLESWLIGEKKKINDKYNNEYIASQKALADRITGIKEQAASFDRDLQSTSWAAQTQIVLGNMSKQQQSQAKLNDELEKLHADLIGGVKESDPILRDLEIKRLEESVNWNRYHDQVLLDNKNEWIAKDKEISDARLKEQVQKEQETWGSVFQITESVSNGIESILSSVNNRKMNEIDKIYKKETDKLNSSKMNNKDRAKELNKLEDEMAKKKI